MKCVAALMIAILGMAVGYPVFAPGAGGDLDTCTGIECAAIDCKPPFEYMAAKDSGTCCPMCWAKTVKVPEDRSWAEGMSGGVGMNNNADPIACRGVMCPELHCPETEQSYTEGRCCSTCSR
eukprot:gnl/TRDRNA2_/TRDRNA2_172556_c0_seq6.p2 gnl/TRDRNA2_/TRDRNA2_172556_c0~~gnl/TRDRNA2_/TRDRNA2_172556_c0_seq6.p2  ORF type:complete len:122 (+),score=32.26 gnl/TRDRNA2_/TRDRNA2_172556_c0_seq6:45-410(+)